MSAQRHGMSKEIDTCPRAFRQIRGKPQQVLEKLLFFSSFSNLHGRARRQVNGESYVSFS
jgi:hypothetical protein